jgi:hypothetical protein
MPDKDVVAVFNEMRALGIALTDKDDRDLADSFFLANEGIHANQWAFVLGALVPAAQNIHPGATYDLRHRLLIDPIGELFQTIPVSTHKNLSPEYQRQHEEARRAKSKACRVAQKFLGDFFLAIKKNICTGRAAGKDISIQSMGAGLAASIAAELLVSQPFAIAIATAVLVLVMKSGKDAFCKMDFEQFWKQVDANTPTPKTLKESSVREIISSGSSVATSSRPRTPRK